MADPFDFNEPETPTPPARKSAESRNIVRLCIGILATLFLIVSFAGIALLAWSQKGKNTGDRDYFRLLEVTYEREAILTMELTWLEEYRESFSEFDERSSRTVANAAKSKAELLEFKQTQLRQAFAQEHGIDSQEWKVGFKKRFPERDVIFDEVRIKARQICRQQALDAMLLFLNKRPTMPIEQWKNYRVDYLRANAPKWINEVSVEVKRLNSIRVLEKKVIAQ